MQSLAKLEKAKLEVWKKSGSITVSECVKNQTLSSYTPKEQEAITKVISATIAKIFYAEGQQVEFNRIDTITELFIEDRKYESPETLIKGLDLIAMGRYGKFYGMPGLTDIQEKFADYLMQTIIPERERVHQQKSRSETKDNERGQTRSLREYIEGSRKTGTVNIPNRFKGLHKS